ncbi:MAG: amino acid adenylation domain-containing protein [Bacilli bacterium]
MKKNQMLLSEEELGIYLSCIDGGLQYNLPFTVEIINKKPTEVTNAISNIFKAHPSLNTQIFKTDDGSLVKELVPITLSIPIKKSIDIDSWPKEFDLINHPLYRFEMVASKEKIVLFCDFHHILMDGTSIRIFLDELEKRLVKDYEIKEESQSFNNGEIEKEERLNVEKYEASKGFYIKTFGNIDCESLPVIDKKEEKVSYSSIDYSINIKADEVRSFRKKSTIRTSTFFLGVYSKAISLFSGLDEAFFLTVNNGRSKENLSSLGMFVKSYPIYTKVPDKGDISTFLSLINLEQEEDIKNSIYSYNELVKDSKINPSSLFSYQGDDFYLNGKLKANLIKVKDGISSFAVELFRINNKFTLHIGYRSDLFNETSVIQFAKVFEQISKEFLKKKNFEDIDLLSKEEKEILNEFHKDNLSSYNQNTNAVEMFEKEAKNIPNNVALVFKDKKVTFKEVKELSDIIATNLVAENYKKGDIGAIFLPRNEWTPIIALSILKAGLAYEPLDATYPDERLAFMLSDSKAKVIFSTKELMKRLPSFKGKVIYLDDILKLKKKDISLPKICPHDLFVILYTSGSTGTPKGVLLEHQGFSYLLQFTKKAFDYKEGTHLSCYASFGFDAGTCDMFMGLTTGATLYIIDESLRMDLKKMNEYLVKEKIDIGFFTTQVGRQLVTDYKNKYWKNVWMGGEKLVPFDIPKGFNISNAYGPTEATVYVTKQVLDKKEYRFPIGKPIDISKIYIIDQNEKELPIGVPGELCISGPQVSRGYLNRDIETKKHFGKNPFSKDPNFTNFYKTGDIVRYLPNGSLDFIGRRDFQVKIRGFRIELSEVEEIIRKYPGIKDATVVSYPDNNGGNYLAAYIVSDKKIDIDDLKDFVGKSKPPYMVPPAILQIERIPLNQNGKVNKKVLPPIVVDKTDIVLPNTDREKLIFEAAKKVLGDTGFGIKEDLFSYGLSSISLMKFLTLLEESLHEDFSVKEVKQCKCVEEIAKLTHKTEKIVSESLKDYPLTKTQEGIFVESISNPTSTVYNVPLLIKLDAKFDLDRLVNAIKKAIDNHPFIKSRLVLSSSGDPRFVKKDEETFISREKKDSIPKDYPLRPFDLLIEPLYRIKIIETKDGNYLFMEFHHLIFDGASVTILFDDISNAYLNKSLKAESKDGYTISLEEEKERTPKELGKQKAYYESFLKGVDASSTPKKEYSSIGKKENAVYEKKLDLPKNLDEFLKKHSLTRKGFYNSIFSYALSIWNDMEESLYTTIYEGRDLASYSNTVTMLVKTIPVYQSIKENETTLEYLKSMEEELSNSEANTLYSFAEVAHDYNVPTDILFAYQGDGFLPTSLASLKIENIPIVSNTPKSIFGVQVVENSSGSVLHFEYDKSLYKIDMPIHFARMMEKLISEFINKDLLNKVEPIDLESKSEIDKYNQTDDPFMYENYAEVFQASVKKNAKKTAVIAIDERLTYEELDKRSNIIANFLLSKGVKKDDKVVVMMPRIANAYSVIQGVIKSGACYAPIDPKYPDDRVNYIIETAEAPLIITTNKIKEERAKTLAKVPLFTIEDIFAGKINTTYPNVKISRDSLAYCIFTSGSTGKPKGVMIEHHSLVNYVSPTKHNLVAKEYLEYGHVTLALASLSFDISVDEEMVPLANGLTIMLASEEEILNPLIMAKRIEKEGVDLAFPVPSYLNNALDVKEVAEAFKNFKLIKTGGEAFSVALYRKVKGLGINAALHNVYGPTEITVANCQDTLTSDENISIGYPSANYKDYIIDRNNHVVPFGAIGEILVGGEGVSRGYVGRDDLNSTKYIMIDGVRAFKTGDIGRFMYDGKIDIFGRRDNQVKLRGLRVELDEIEANIDRYPGITKSICLVKENPKDGQFLVGYYTCDKDINIEDLKKHLAKSLTSYMIPQVFMKMESFPTNNNGKVDKKALPTPEKQVNTSVNIRKPKNELQQKLFDIYQKVLGISDFSIDDDFFTLGGSSLSASKVAMLAMEENLPLSYSDVFDNPSIADLYDFIILNKKEKPQQKENKFEVISKKEKVLDGLKYNTFKYLDEMKIDHSLGKVLLFGATGFLGIHVLRELLKDPKQEVVCVLRTSKGINPEAKLKGLLAYYFDSPFESSFGKQITVVDGDLTDTNLNVLVKNIKFNTIINCAALVKHFANDDSIERVNFHGVENLISLAENTNTALVHVSTLSVAGANVDHKFNDERRIHETEIDFGQDITNKYVHSKFMAEEAIEKAISKDHLKGKIIRVGNLMPRNSDGEFQINYITNNFMNSLKAYAALGVFPVSQADMTVDFTPIDEVAKTVLLFARTPEKFTLLHSANSHEVEMGDVISAMNNCGFDIKLVSDNIFNDKLHTALKEGDEKVSSLIRYNVSEGTSTFIMSDNSYSIKALYRLGYHWPIISENYLNKAIKALKDLMFFEE